jgi:hypothetical protein
MLRLRRAGAAGIDILLFGTAALGWGILWDTVRWLAGLGSTYDVLSGAAKMSELNHLTMLVGPGLAAVALLVYFGALPTCWGCTFGGALLGLRVEAVGWPRAALRVLVFPGPVVVAAAIGASAYAFGRPGTAVAAAAAIGAAVVLAVDLIVAGLAGSGGASLHDYAGATRVVHTPAATAPLLLRSSGAVAVDWWLTLVAIGAAGAFGAQPSPFFSRGVSLFRWPWAWLVSAALVLVYFGIFPACRISTLGRLLFGLRPGPAGGGTRSPLLAGLRMVAYPGPVCTLMVLAWLVPRGRAADGMELSSILRWIWLLRAAYLACGIILGVYAVARLSTLARRDLG